MFVLGAIEAVLVEQREKCLIAGRLGLFRDFEVEVVPAREELVIARGVRDLLA